MSTTVAILLCTYNGEKFLQEQLDSFVTQTFKNWELFVYDDGSTDSTKTIVKNFQTKTQNKIHFISNKKKMGFAKNFLNAVHATCAGFDFYAFSDQDDIWLPSKLERAIECLNKTNRNMPALYGSRTTLIDSGKNHIGFSTLFLKKPSFSHALVQCIAGGNTMVFNAAAKNLLDKTKRDLEVASHDCFIYQLIAGAGGVIHYDSRSEILYRQHSNNLSGANKTFAAKLHRIKNLFNGSFRKLNDMNVNALNKNSKLLTQESKAVLDCFVRSRKSSLLHRVWGFRKCGIYRQTFAHNLALLIGVMLNKV